MPTRMGTAGPRSRQLDALALVIAQHDQIDQLIALLEDDALLPARKPAILRALADIVGAHVLMEEQLFYPAVRARQAEDILLDAVAEHRAIQRVLAELRELRLADPRFEVQLAVLKEELQHHAREEEEQVLFPEVRRLFSEEELAQLGHDMHALFDRALAPSAAPLRPGEARPTAAL